MTRKRRSGMQAHAHVVRAVQGDAGQRIGDHYRFCVRFLARGRGRRPTCSRAPAARVCRRGSHRAARTTRSKNAGSFRSRIRLKSWTSAKITATISRVALDAPAGSSSRSTDTPARGAATCTHGPAEGARGRHVGGRARVAGPPADHTCGWVLYTNTAVSALYGAARWAN